MLNLTQASPTAFHAFVIPNSLNREESRRFGAKCCASLRARYAHVLGTKRTCVAKCHVNL